MKKTSILLRSLAAVALVAASAAAFASGVFQVPSLQDGMVVAFGGIIVNRDSLSALYTGFKAAFNGALGGVDPHGQSGHVDSIDYGPGELRLARPVPRCASDR